MGYATREVVMEVTGHQLKHIDIELDASSVQLDDVVVSASRNAVRRCEAPVVVNILNHQSYLPGFVPKHILPIMHSLPDGY